MTLSRFFPKIGLSSERLNLCLEISQALTESKINDELKHKIENYNEILESNIKTTIDAIEMMEAFNGSEKFMEMSKKKSSTKSEIEPKKVNESGVVSVSAKTTKAVKQIDIGRVEFRVGKIIDIKKHPDADSLFVETVDIGDQSGRMKTVCSGLVNKIPIDQLKDKVAIFCCNLKPAKMRGVISEAMIMCASNGESVEVLEPPKECKIGDVITCVGYTYNPDQVLNPKEKIWEAVQPNLKVNSDGIVVYCDTPVVVGVSGNLKAPSLKDCKVT